MSDKKHIEYCIKLGNISLQDKLTQFGNSNFIEPNYNENANEQQDFLSFKERIKNWK